MSAINNAALPKTAVDRKTSTAISSTSAIVKIIPTINDSGADIVWALISRVNRAVVDLFLRNLMILKISHTTNAAEMPIEAYAA